MIKLGIWSYSNHFKYKVFPSIKNNRKINVVAILSNKEKDKELELKNIKWFKNKKSFFDFCNLDYVYISSINSKHFVDCKYALNKNVNVICEKPMCLDLDQLNKLNKIAREKRKNIFEMIQYTSHPLFIKLRKILSSKKIGEITKVESSFKIPLNDRKNFRFHNNCGGGALFDVGFYPISTMFTLFGSKRIKIEKIKKTNCHDRSINNHSASGGPKTCPALPAAVTMASDIDRFSSDDARPTTANMTPNPVPAIPKPINNALI